MHIPVGLLHTYGGRQTRCQCLIDLEKSAKPSRRSQRCQLTWLQKKSLSTLFLLLHLSLYDLVFFLAATDFFLSPVDPSDLAGETFLRSSLVGRLHLQRHIPLSN